MYLTLSLFLMVGTEVVHAQFKAPVPETNGFPSAHSSHSVSTLPAPISTRQTAFNIPYSVDQNTNAREVQLHVSTDRGQTWNLYARQQAGTGQFQFRAQRDGEYWFSSKTIDAQERFLPDAALRPELRVVVDTTQPQFNFSAEADPSGGVLTQWNIYDASLNAQSFKIEYQSATGQPWKPVAFERPGNSGPRSNLSGRTTWYPQVAGNTINIRAEVQDQAGNSTVVIRQVTLPQGARQTPATQDATPANPKPPADPFTRPAQPSVGAKTWPKDNMIPPSRSMYSNRYADQVASRRAQQSPNLYSDEKTAASPVAMEHDKPASRSETATPTVSNSAANDDPSALTDGVSPVMTNLSHFHLDYDVDLIGPEGVSDVELWATTDGGKNWVRWGKDEDRTSPLDVEVDREGVYGFRIVIFGKNGLASQPPHPGDMADIWVGVDTTKPIARLTSARYGENDQIGKLVIQWQADDANLAELPVKLSFSDNPSGRWTTIAAGLPNSGEYLWPADPRLPPKIYLRLEARDEAGNIAVDQLTEPINVAGLVPRGRIRSLRPAENDGSVRGAQRLPIP
jgi:hypothetical protein